MPLVKIHFRGHFIANRAGGQALPGQIVRQLHDAIVDGRVALGTRLPSTRSLARELRVSRNTVSTAYDELAARGLIRSRRGSGTYVCAPAAAAAIRERRVLREAQYARRELEFRDPDGTTLYFSLQ
jgi:GntR family transcriptional regulator / MocR family aminotransferase